VDAGPSHHLSDTEVFTHVRMLLSVVVSLSIARLLSGLAVFVQHPGRQKPDTVHLLWAASVLLMLVHFWWWEMALAYRSAWRFEVYAFLLFYATLNYLICAVLFPLDLTEYQGWRHYFESRRAWFFGLLALSFVTDLADTWLKGLGYLVSLSPEYLLRLGAYLVLFLAASLWQDRRFQLAFASANLVYQLSWILRLYDKVR